MGEPQREVNQPSGRPAVRMRWDSLLFLHWPLPVELLTPLIPAELEVDTFDGSAWVGLVPFTMPVIRPTWWPSSLHMRSVTTFHECNVRTYVRYRGEGGVWFLSLDAASGLGVWGARRFWHLPYFHANISMRHRDHDQIEYELHRCDRRVPPASMRCRWEVGAALPRSGPDGLDHFLTERYQLFCQSPEGIRRSRILHEPWTLHQARCLELQDELVAAAGLPGPFAAKEVLARAARPLDVWAWPLRR